MNVILYDAMGNGFVSNGLMFWVQVVGQTIRTGRDDSVPSENFHDKSVNIWKVGAIHKGGESVVPDHGIDLSLCLSNNLRIQSKR